MNISLRQLEIFVAIVECGNFTEAGRHLYLAQSTVSSHISGLEEILRVQLFRRKSKRAVELTDEGKRVYHYAKEVVNRCGELEKTIVEEMRRELVIGASTAPSKSFLPGYVLKFGQEYPECCCVVRSGDSEQIQQMVLDGDVQLGFVGSTDNRQALNYERVTRDRLVMVTPNTPKFAKLHQQGVLGKSLMREPMVFRDQGSGTQKMIDNYLSSQEIPTKEMQVRYYASDPGMLQELVALGAGVSIMSALSVQDQVQAGKLLTFELSEQPVSRDIYMVYRKKGALSELAERFAEMVRKSVQ